MSAQALVRRLYAALGAGDEPALRGVLAPDFIGTFSAGFPLGIGGTRIGPDAAITETWWAIGRAFRVRVDPEDWRVCEDGRLVVTGIYRGSGRASGREFEAAFVHVVTARDGRIAALTQVTDTTCWAAAL